MFFNLTTQINVRFNSETNLGYFKEQLLGATENKIETVEFFTITGSRIPLSEKVQDLNDFPVILQINKNRVFSLNFSQEFEIDRKTSHNCTKEEYFYDFAVGIGMKGYQKYFLPNFACRLMEALPKGTKSYSSQEIGDSLATVFRY